MRAYIFHRVAMPQDNVMKLIINHKRGNKATEKAAANDFLADRRVRTCSQVLRVYVGYNTNKVRFRIADSVRYCWI